MFGGYLFDNFVGYKLDWVVGVDYENRVVGFVEGGSIAGDMMEIVGRVDFDKDSFGDFAEVDTYYFETVLLEHNFDLGFLVFNSPSYLLSHLTN